MGIPPQHLTYNHFLFYCLAAVTLLIIGNVINNMITATANCLITTSIPVVSLVYIKESKSLATVYRPVLISRVKASINRAPDTAIA